MWYTHIQLCLRGLIKKLYVIRNIRVTVYVLGNNFFKLSVGVVSWLLTVLHGIYCQHLQKLSLLVYRSKHVLRNDVNYEIK
jgi:hypothetical protein